MGRPHPNQHAACRSKSARQLRVLQDSELESRSGDLGLRVPFTFRQGFIGGAIVAFAIGVYLVWLWQPAHQVELHTDHFLRNIERHDFAAVRDAVAEDYQDDWSDNRDQLFERMRGILRFTRNMRINAIVPSISVEGRDASWLAVVKVNGDDDEVMAEIKQRVNPLSTPFKLQWRRQSGKPWDWELRRVSNRELKIDAAGY